MKPDEELWVSLPEIKEIELAFQKRSWEVVGGEHLSVFRGSGFNLMGLRDWEPGDKISAVDWPQSSLNNFNPLVIREFEETRNTIMLIVADDSLSMRCGQKSLLTAQLAAQAVATLGLSGSFFQDPVGMAIFEGSFWPHSFIYIKPRIGRAYLMHCLRSYQFPVFKPRSGRIKSAAQVIGGCLKRPGLVPIISDFLFPEALATVESFRHLKAKHDVLVLVIDSSFIFDLPAMAEGWVRVADVESGHQVVVSRRRLNGLVNEIRQYQKAVVKTAKDLGLSALLLSADKDQLRWQLMDFFLNRKQSKILA